MAKSSADDKELRRACEAAIEGTKQNVVMKKWQNQALMIRSFGEPVKHVVMSIRVAKSKGAWGKGKVVKGQMAKPRVLAITSKDRGDRFKAFLRVLKYTINGGELE
nr:hypothetical protein [Tanacetum cinerariifolium]